MRTIGEEMEVISYHLLPTSRVNVWVVYDTLRRPGFPFPLLRHTDSENPLSFKRSFIEPGYRYIGRSVEKILQPGFLPSPSIHWDRP